jgi:hypothetical protein
LEDLALGARGLGFAVSRQFAKGKHVANSFLKDYFFFFFFC